MAELITKEILKEEYESKMLKGEKRRVKNPVTITGTQFGRNIPNSGSIVDDKMMSLIDGAIPVGRNVPISLSGKYDSGFDFPFGKRGSIHDRIRKGVFKDDIAKVFFASGGGNTLNDNWTDLMDAIRMDLTIKKEGQATIRQFIYSEIQMPNATKDIRPSELYPYGIVFEENNGEGQSVRQGANLGGAVDTIPMKIYAAGFIHSLLAALFDGTYDLTRLNDGVAVGYAAKRDDLAIAPIFADVYSTVGTAKWTASSSLGTLRQEHLWNTLIDVIDGLSVRIDPITKRKIPADGCVLLGTNEDMRHVAHVMGGIGTGTPEKYNAISGISKLIGYEGEVIDMPNETVTYAGATDKIAYLIKPNRYFKIPIKRNLVMEVDSQPNVNTLAQEQKAWYFVESMYNEVGIDSFIQKVTLPAW